MMGPQRLPRGASGPCAHSRPLLEALLYGVIRPGADRPPWLKDSLRRAPCPAAVEISGDGRGGSSISVKRKVTVPVGRVAMTYPLRAAYSGMVKIARRAARPWLRRSFGLLRTSSGRSRSADHTWLVSRLPSSPGVQALKMKSTERSATIGSELPSLTRNRAWLAVGKCSWDAATQAGAISTPI